MHQQLRSLFFNFGSWILDVGLRFTESGMWNLEFGINNMKPETLNLKLPGK